MTITYDALTSPNRFTLHNSNPGQGTSLYMIPWPPPWSLLMKSGDQDRRPFQIYSLEALSVVTSGAY